MKAVILAGGKGTRLGELTRNVPKPMVKIGEKTLLEHNINLLTRYGIKDEIIITTGHLADAIEDHFKDGKEYGVSITYYREETPLGTTGALKELEGKLTHDFLVLSGDVLTNMDLKRLIEYHKKKKATATLVLHPNDHPYDSDLAEIDDEGRITAFIPKPHDDGRLHKNLVNAGLYVLSPNALGHIHRGKGDFGKDLFPRLIKTEPIYGYVTTEYIKDAGTPQRLEEVTAAYVSGKSERRNLEHKQKAIFLDRDGVINKEINLLHRKEDFELLPGSAEAIKKINQSDYLAIVATNQPVVARNLCSIEDVKGIHMKMETLLGEKGAYVDAVYFCPHHPDKGYPEENPAYKIECSCRKPKTGMIDEAVAAYNIDRHESYIIGDSQRDVQCGKNAGLTAIGIRNASSSQPVKEADHVFESLNDAVDFILDKKKQS
ncbi:UTP--glucose-1-phosphate uridylyltransferase AglF [uncultured archaeon]|nr:UTP--glucose-1-phosphate uridylyltransferase AglF [uncultured archaeon]